MIEILSKKEEFFMPTPHNEAKLEDIAKTVIMPGDPLRAKYIAENFLEDVKLVNSVRGMYTYTGNYKGMQLTVMASGMGIPSMGIYSYELFHFYNVENIIRIGTCGSLTEDLDLLDIILVDKSYTESNYALSLDNVNVHVAESSSYLNSIIENTSNDIGIKCNKKTTLCNECFDPYIDDLQGGLDRLPKELNLSACEMEAFALFYNAKKEGKNAACLLSVVDTLKDKKGLSPEERQNGLNAMIKLALESAVKL